MFNPTSKLVASSTILLAASWGCGKGSAEREDTSLDPPASQPDPSTLPDTMPFEDTPVGKNGHLHVEGTQLVNEDGEPIQLRGVSSMWLNWESAGYATNYGALQWMRDNWGVSLIRAAMGVSTAEREPAQGGYLTSATSMENTVERIVNNATDLGVYVLIDWHDHFAQDNVEESKDFFRRMAAQYEDNPSVIYEIFNEPMPGAFGPAGGGERFGWAEDFKPYHEAVIAEIRKEDEDGVIVLGTPFWSQNVDEAAADPVEGDNLMYTVHFYSCTHDAWLRDKAQTALDAGLAIFVTEWGATDAEGGVNDLTVCDDEADRWHDFMNRNGISWAAWKLDDCSEASCLLSSGAPRAGGWDDYLQGHGPYVVEKLTAPEWTPDLLGGGQDVAAAGDSGVAAAVDAGTAGGSGPDAGSERADASRPPTDAAVEGDVDAAVPHDAPREAGSSASRDAGDAEAKPVIPPKRLPDAAPPPKTTDAALN
jgi:aryl-phospho-beta-D-glucosidase BglC (GH1 family)